MKKKKAKGKRTKKRKGLKKEIDDPLNNPLPVKKKKGQAQHRF